MKFPILILLAAALGFGCMSARIKPGRSVVNTGQIQAQAVQSDDPKTATVQTVETETISRPALLRLGDDKEPGQKVIFGELVKREKVTTTIGAAQKNAAAEIAAKLASVRWLQWVGVAVALFGVASLSYPPLRLLVGSVTLGAWCIASGAAMVVLPLVIVGNEILILSICGGVVAVWFFAHRHGSLRGEIETLKNYVESKNQS